MAVAVPTCACPADSLMQSMAKANNNQIAIYFLMSSGAFRGDAVNLGSCLCSPAQIMATMANNAARFFTWLANNGGSPVDPTISSWDQLAAVPTVGMAVGTIKLWVDSSAGVLRATQLLAGTDATDQPSGVQRPNDYNAATNAKVWFNKAA